MANVETQRAVEDVWAAGGDGFRVLSCDGMNLLVEKWASK